MVRLGGVGVGTTWNRKKKKQGRNWEGWRLALRMLRVNNRIRIRES